MNEKKINEKKMNEKKINGKKINEKKINEKKINEKRMYEKHIKEKPITELTKIVVEKKVLLDQVQGLYAVGTVLFDGREYYAAASENRGGEIFLIHAQSGEVIEIKGGPGGVMAVIEADGERALLCIEEFYPVFDSAAAKIVKVELVKNGTEKDQSEKCGAGDGREDWREAENSRTEKRCTSLASVRRTIVAEVPYVHRIAQLREADGVFIAAGKLCKQKTYSEDWSTSGSMEIGRYTPESGVTAFERVQDGIHKHHAMFVKKNTAGYDDLYYGGSEGAFYTTRTDGRWETRQLLSVPVSDLVCLDLDGDREEELAVIEGFHGNAVVIFKNYGNGYERSLELPLNFGHVLWGGSFLGEPGLIAGSRGGEKRLILYRFACDSQNKIRVRSQTVIDEGQAPAQIAVNEAGENAEIVAANHGAAQLVRYRCCRQTTDKG